MQIDRFGRFTYVLVKLSDRTAGSKLLVRGKNGRSEAQLLSAVTKEVRSGCRRFLCFELCSDHTLNSRKPAFLSWSLCNALWNVHAYGCHEG